MLNQSYLPQKVLMHADDGRKIEAITFVMNHQSPSYVADLSLDEKARIIAEAEGFLGISHEYLDLTWPASMTWESRIDICIRS